MHEAVGSAGFCSVHRPLFCVGDRADACRPDARRAAATRAASPASALSTDDPARGASGPVGPDEGQRLDLGPGGRDHL